MRILDIFFGGRVLVEEIQYVLGGEGGKSGWEITRLKRIFQIPTHFSKILEEHLLDTCIFVPPFSH